MGVKVVGRLGFLCTTPRSQRRDLEATHSWFHGFGFMGVVLAQTLNSTVNHPCLRATISKENLSSSFNLSAPPATETSLMS